MSNEFRRERLVLLFDDQRSAGRRHADELTAELGVTVAYFWDVERTIDEIQEKRFDLCILDYSDIRGWGDSRCGLDIVKRGIYQSPLNRNTPVIIYSLFAIPVPEIDKLHEYGNIAFVKNQLLGAEGLVTLVAKTLKISWTRSEKVSSRVTGVGEIEEWQENAGRAVVVVPSWSDSKRLVVEWSYLGQDLVEEIGSMIDELGGTISASNPLLVRVEFNERAKRSEELDLRVLDRIGPASAFRSALTWKAAPERIDPEAPTGTPAGERAAARAPLPADWESLHAEWEELAATDNTSRET